MTRRFIFAFLLILASLASAQTKLKLPEHANNVLVLIQPALAGPEVDPLNYWQPLWILWPPALRPSDGGRLLSIATGLNWVGSSADFRFQPVDHGHAWQAVNYRDLVARGVFEARERNLSGVRTDLLVGATGSASVNALRLALNPDSPVVWPFRVDQKIWPTDSLMVAEASSWDEVATIESATDGRVLVVEYPPRPDVPWTRYWLRGHGWKIRSNDLFVQPELAVVPDIPGFPVPGLIWSRQLIPLVSHPQNFEADRVSIQNWPGANRFLELRRSCGLWVTGLWVLSVAGVVIWGATLVANERTSRVAPVLLTGALLSPAIVDLAGILGRYLGLSGWPVWLGLAGVVLVGLSKALELAISKGLPSAHPLLATCAVGLATVCIVNPIWSFMSSYLSVRTTPEPAVAAAAVIGYLTGVVAFLRIGEKRHAWLGVGIWLLVFFGGFVFGCWWDSDMGTALFLVVVWPIAAGHFQRKMLPSVAVMAAAFSLGSYRGIVWAPLGLLYRSTDQAGLNLALYAEFLTNPCVWIFILVAGSVALFGFRFLLHQLRMVMRRDDRRRALPLLSIAASAYAIIVPAMLNVAIVLASGAVVALLIDAVQTM